MTAAPDRGWRWLHRPAARSHRENGDDDSATGSQLVPVNLDRSQFRSARWWLLGEAVALLALGVAGLIIRHPGGVAGRADWELALTPIHSWLLIGAGILAALATLRRRTAVAAATFGAIAGLLMFAIGTASLGTPASGHSTLRLWHYQVGDSVLFCVLTAYNFALLLWLVANALQGPAWIRRRTDADGGPDDAEHESRSNRADGVESHDR